MANEKKRAKAEEKRLQDAIALKRRKRISIIQGVLKGIGVIIGGSIALVVGLALISVAVANPVATGLLIGFIIWACK